MSPKISILTMILAIATMSVGVFAVSFEKVRISSDDIQVPVRKARSVLPRASQPIQLCGYRLLEALRGLCGNFIRNKRSDTIPGLETKRGNLVEKSDTHYLNNEDLVENTSSKTSQALVSLGNGRSPPYHRRYRRNIIDECCKRSCSVNNMIKYCARN